MGKLSSVVIVIICVALASPTAAFAVNPVVLFAADYIGGRLLDQVVDPLTGQPDPKLLRDELRRLEKSSATRPEVAAAVRDLQLSISDRVTRDEFQLQVRSTCERLTSITDRLDAVEIRLEVLEVETDDLRNNTNLAKSSKTFVRRAEDFAKQNDFHRALANLNRAVALDPHDHEALVARARLFLERRMNGPALADADSAVALQPADVTTRQLRIVAAMRCGDYERAIEDGRYFQGTSDPDLQQRAEGIVARAEAMQAARRLASINVLTWPDDAGRKAEIEKWRARLQAAVAIDDAFAPAHYYLALSSDDFGTWLTEMQKAVELDPRCLDARYRLASLYATRGQSFDRREGDLEKSKELCDEIIAMNPESRKGLSDVYSLRGELRSRLTSSADAIADFTKAYELDPTNRYAVQKRAWEHDRMGLKSEAERDYAELRRLETLAEVKARPQQAFEPEWAF